MTAYSIISITTAVVLVGFLAACVFLEWRHSREYDAGAEAFKNRQRFSYQWTDAKKEGWLDAKIMDAGRTWRHFGFVDRSDGGHGRESIKKSHRAEGRNFID